MNEYWPTKFTGADHVMRLAHVRSQFLESHTKAPGFSFHRLHAPRQFAGLVGRFVQEFGNRLRFVGLGQIFRLQLILQQ